MTINSYRTAQGTRLVQTASGTPIDSTLSLRERVLNWFRSGENRYGTAEQRGANKKSIEAFYAELQFTHGEPTAAKAFQEASMFSALGKGKPIGDRHVSRVYAIADAQLALIKSTREENGRELQGYIKNGIGVFGISHDPKLVEIFVEVVAADPRFTKSLLSSSVIESMAIQFLDAQTKLDSKFPDVAVYLKNSCNYVIDPDRHEFEAIRTLRAPQVPVSHDIMEAADRTLETLKSAKVLAEAQVKNIQAINELLVDIITLSEELASLPSSSEKEMLLKEALQFELSSHSDQLAVAAGPIAPAVVTAPPRNERTPGYRLNENDPFRRALTQTLKQVESAPWGSEVHTPKLADATYRLRRALLEVTRGDPIRNPIGLARLIVRLNEAGIISGESRYNVMKAFDKYDNLV